MLPAWDAVSGGANQGGLTPKVGAPGATALTLGPLMLPALVTGVGLLQLFQYAGLREQIGFTALVVGHIVICLPFAVRTVAISLHALPPNLELAASL